MAAPSRVQAPPPVDVMAHIVPQLTVNKRGVGDRPDGCATGASAGELLKHKLAETLRG